MKSVDIDRMLSLVEQNLAENIQESLETLQSTETSPHASPNYTASIFDPTHLRVAVFRNGA